MTDLVRVKDKKTGHEFSWPVDLVEGVEGIDVLDKDALAANGEPEPPKHKTTVAKAASAKNSAPSGQKAESTKENS